MSTLQVNIIAYCGFNLSASEQDSDFDIRSILRNKKSIKFMAKQDRMAVLAATNAFNMAGLDSDDVGENTGIYFTMGHIPFEQQPLDVLYQKSINNNEFSMQHFSTQAATALNPLLTFKCLPNMPVFHVSYNLNITGRYYVSYPGAGQWFQALQHAMIDLENQRVEYAIVGAVADQLNPLVQHHVQRSLPESLNTLVDAAAVLVLSKNTANKSIGEISELNMHYTAQDLINHAPNKQAIKRALYHDNIDAGAVDPALAITRILDQKFDNKKSTNNNSVEHHEISISTIDGITANLMLTA